MKNVYVDAAVNVANCETMTVDVALVEVEHQTAVVSQIVDIVVTSEL